MSSKRKHSLGKTRRDFSRPRLPARLFPVLKTPVAGLLTKVMGAISNAMPIKTQLVLGLFLVLTAPLRIGAQENSSTTNQSTASETIFQLQQRLGDLVAEPRFTAGLWGIKIASLDSGKTLFEYNPQKLFSPASNSKLYTVALALKRLGADFRIRTSVYAKAKPDADGNLAGDLVLYGRGDPTINARLHSDDIFKAIAPLVDGVAKAGIKQVSGDLVADCSFLRGPEFGSGWVWEDQENYYGAEISALTINDNYLQLSVKPGAKAGDPCQLRLIPETDYLVFSNRTLTVASGEGGRVSCYRLPDHNVVYVSGELAVDAPARVEDVTMHNPAGLFGSLLKTALARKGIEIHGNVRTMNWLDWESAAFKASDYTEVAFLESPPMSDLAREVEKPSQNLYADLLLGQVGEKARSATTPRDRTSEELGIGELRDFLKEAGVKRGDVQFEEGSGLSRDNLTTPNATVALLTYMTRQPCAEAYRLALPIAGVDGTLRNRMKGTAAANNLRAKTGTLRWANSLSGYVTSAAGEHLVFSLMLNRYVSTEPAHSARHELDMIGEWLAELGEKSK